MEIGWRTHKPLMMSSIISSLPSSPSSIHLSFSPNPALVTITTGNPPHAISTKSLRIFNVKLCAASGDQSRTSLSPLIGDILRNLAVSSVILLGLGCGHRGFSASAAVGIDTPVAPSVDSQIQDIGDVGKLAILEDDDTREAFEKWKSKTYALNVSLRIVALRNSFPPIWFKDFIRSQGKRVKLQLEFRQSLQDILSGLRAPLKKRVVSPMVAADLVTVGDSWLSFAIKEGLIDPIEGVEEQDWFQDLTEEWKVYLRRSTDGKLDPRGQVWAAPYRWGSMVIAYKKSIFKKHNLDPIEDWADLWRPELAGKISMVDSPREIIGAVLKYMGSSYNTHDIASGVAGGKTALLEKLLLLTKQVRLFDSQYYLKAFGVGDVWVAVGWSSDILPAARRMSNVAVIVPKSGSSLWADLWAVPAASKIKMAGFGGRVRGPSPLVIQWIEFCLQYARALSFKDEVIPGAIPSAFKDFFQESDRLGKGRPKLESNLVAGVPPPEILAKCEFLETLAEDTLADYQQLMDGLNRPEPPFMRAQNKLCSVLKLFLAKLQQKTV